MRLALRLMPLVLLPKARPLPRPTPLPVLLMQPRVLRMSLLTPPVPLLMLLAPPSKAPATPRSQLVRRCRSPD